MHQVLHPYNIRGEMNNYFNQTQEDKILFTECKEALQCTLKLYMDVIFVSVFPKYCNSDTICNDTNFMLHSTKSISLNIRYNNKVSTKIGMNYTVLL